MFSISFAAFAEQRQREVVQTARLRSTRANPCNKGRCLGLDGGSDSTGGGTYSTAD